MKRLRSVFLLLVFASVLLRYNRFFTHQGFWIARHGALVSGPTSGAGSLIDTYQAYSGTRKSCRVEYFRAMILRRVPSTHASHSKTLEIRFVSQAIAQVCGLRSSTRTR
jgi:hypothetical protein